MCMIGCFSDWQCPNYAGASCIDGSCPAAPGNRDMYAEYGCDVVYECGECWCYHGCSDCWFYGKCDPRDYVLFGEVSNNYRKMHGFPLKRRLKGKYIHANQ